MSDLSKYFQDPNGPAYRKQETRSGPPFDYVGEKLRNALFELHGLLKTAQRVRRTFSSTGAERLPQSARDDLDAVEHSAGHAFAYQVTAFLALHNMLGATGAPDHLGRLRAVSPDDFERWLDFIEREGSVLGA